MSVRPKKHLGQHFLTDLNIAQNIAGALTGVDYQDVLEVGPGMGVLTQYLLQTKHTIHAIEVDNESVDYLNTNFPYLLPLVGRQSRLTLGEVQTHRVRVAFGGRD